MPSPRVGWVHVGPRKRSKSKLNLRGLGIEPDPPRPCGTIILILPFLRVDIYTVPVDLVDHVLSRERCQGLSSATSGRCRYSSGPFRERDSRPVRRPVFSAARSPRRGWSEGFGQRVDYCALMLALGSDRRYCRDRPLSQPQSRTKFAIVTGTEPRRSYLDRNPRLSRSLRLRELAQEAAAD